MASELEELQAHVAAFEKRHAIRQGRRAAWDKLVKDYVDAIFRVIQMTVAVGVLLFAGLRTQSSALLLMAAFLTILGAAYLWWVPMRAVENWIDERGDKLWVKIALFIIAAFITMSFLTGIVTHFPEILTALDSAVRR